MSRKIKTMTAYGIKLKDGKFDDWFYRYRFQAQELLNSAKDPAGRIPKSDLFHRAKIVKVKVREE